MQIISTLPKPSSFCSKASAQPLPGSQALPAVWHSLWQKASFVVIPMMHRGQCSRDSSCLGTCACGRCSETCNLGRVPGIGTMLEQSSLFLSCQTTTISNSQGRGKSSQKKRRFLCPQHCWLKRALLIPHCPSLCSEQEVPLGFL